MRRGTANAVRPCYHPGAARKNDGAGPPAPLQNSISASKYPRIRYGDARGASADIVAVAVDELVRGLGAMLGRAIASEPDPAIGARELRIEIGPGASARAPDTPTLDGDSFELLRAGTTALVLRAGAERGLIHAAADLLERLGARFAPGAPPRHPQIEPSQLAALDEYRVVPAFSRRAFASDIMTWNYSFPDRLALHLAHDRDFIAWMARRGANAFSYIRHAHDTRLRIDELAALYRSHGIASEYGGHVLQILLPRERCDANPEYFPAGDDGVRAPRGNLCVSNRSAIDLVCGGAVKYVSEFPENELLHVWGADVSGGAWCRCGQCRELPPQLQYMEVVNAIANALGEKGAGAPPVAYLAYHDTIEPHPGLRPLPNVWFEWAPRERCYSHAIDDPVCDINPRYFASLKRHVEIFEGRGHVFEYYADAILFGGLGFATPAIIARDLRAYRALGLRSISCLTFGAYSALAYPVNLDAFLRAARAPDFDLDASVGDTAAGRHPTCAPEMAAAYRAIGRASEFVLDYADVMSPAMAPGKAARKHVELGEAALIFDQAIAAANRILAARETPLAAAEREIWRYSAEVLSGIAGYLAALAQQGEARRRAAEASIARIAGAIEHVRAIDLDIKGTWGAYDLEWIHELWLDAMKRNLAEPERVSKEMI